MLTKELVLFIEAEFKAGQTRDGLLALLTHGGGWNHQDAENAIREYERTHTPISVGEMRANMPEVATTHAPATPFNFPPVMQSKTQEENTNVGEHAQERGGVGPVVAEQTPTLRNVAGSGAAVSPPIRPTAFSSPTIVAPHVRPATSPVSLPRGGAVPPTQHTDPVMPARADISPNATFARNMFPHAPSSPADIGKAALLPVAPNLKGPQPGASLRKTGSRTKIVILVILGALLVLGLFAFGGYLLLTRVVPEEDKVFSTMYASIPGIQSFRYAGETRLNFTGEAVDALKSGYEEGYTGMANISLKYDGRADLAKGSNGVHQFGITAELRSGEYNISVDSSIELRLIGDTYYLKVTDPPTLRDIDLSRLKTYWIAISPQDIIAYLGGNPTTNEEEYGGFGGAPSTTTLRGMITMYPPLESATRVGEEDLAGAQTVHYQFRGNAEHLLTILRYIVEKVSGKPWLMDDTEHANILAMLRGVSGDIWIDAATYLPRKIVLNQPLKGIVSGISVDGRLEVEQNYSEYNGGVGVQAPRPVMTYPEFAADVRRQAERAKATGDARRVIDAEDIASALNVYRANHEDRYPTSLELLVADGLLREVPKDPDDGAYLYGAYMTVGKVDNKSACTENSPTCVFYHLGITLVDPKHEVLAKDADLLGNIVTGADTRGCAKEVKKACYDLVPGE